MGKHPVHRVDRAGFIVKALLFPYLNDAVHMLEADYAGVDESTPAMKLGTSGAAVLDAVRGRDRPRRVAAYPLSAAGQLVRAP